MSRQRLIATIEILFAVVVWGMSFIATKVALRQVSPVVVVWLRFAIGVLILGIAMAARKQLALPAGRESLYFAGLGFVGITFHQWLQSTGLVTAQASTTAWIVSTTPVFMAFLGWLFLKEKLSIMQVFGIALAMGGVLLVVSKGNLAGLVSGRFGTLGDLLILISAPNWAVFSILSRRGLLRNPASYMMFYVMAAGWLFTSILFIYAKGWSELGHLQWDGWLGVLFLGVFCSGLAYIAWYDGLQAIQASQVGAFLYIEPLVAVVTAALVLGESFSWTSLLGGGVILSGVWLVQQHQRG